MPSVNLIPVDLRVRRQKRRCIQRWTMASLVVWLIAAVPIIRELSAQFHLSAQRQGVDEINHMLATAQVHSDRSVKRLELLRAEIARAQQLRYKRKWSLMWAAIESVMPKTVWLTLCRTDPAKPAVSSSSMSPIAYKQAEGAAQAQHEDLVGKSGSRRLLLEGQATGLEEIYVLVGALNGLGIFEGASLRAVREDAVEGVNVTRFEVECHW